MASSSSAEASTFKFLVTTDNHLGFAERDPRRGDDSFTTMEEILRAARIEHDVDAILLGGDLFHDNKPSQGCLTRSCSLFRKYVLGEKPIGFSLLSDPAKNFPTHALPLANFQDPNMNVALPVFGIHGNHDDPVGGTSALDILATNGYLNYFGHVPSLEEIVVEPVLLRKGDTFIALFGLGNVRDERLHRCFRLKKVSFVHPKPVMGRRWFSILLLHQNRGVRGAGSKAGIFENMLAGFGFDLVIWGNEHEQMMVPQPSEGFDVVQPGSSILTSLSAQECNPKQYGVLEVRGSSYRLTPFNLRSIRPAVRRTVELRRDHPTGRTLDAIETFLRAVVEEMIGEAEDMVAAMPDDVLAFHPNLKFPLMRLAVDFTDDTSVPFPQPNLNRFGQQYMDVVANPEELLRPVKPKPVQQVGARVRRGGNADGSHQSGDAQGMVVPVAPQLSTLDIRTKVAEVFNQEVREGCTLFSEPEVSAAVYAFAEKDERSAITERLMDLLHQTQKRVWRKMQNGDSEAILKPDQIMQAVHDIKCELNQRYAKNIQAEQAAQLQSTGDGLGDEEGDEQGTNGSEQAVENEAFLPPHSTHASTLVRDVLRTQTEPADTSATAASIKREGVAWLREVGAGDGDADGEELPEDGLHRTPVSHIIAGAMRQGGREMPVLPLESPGKKRSRVDVDVVDVDGDDTNGDDVTLAEALEKVRQLSQESSSATPRKGRRPQPGAQPASARRSPSPKPKAPPSRRRGAAKAASGAPTLQLTDDLRGDNPTAPRAPTRGKQSTGSGGGGGGGAVLDLLSKWGSQH